MRVESGMAKDQRRISNFLEDQITAMACETEARGLTNISKHAAWGSVTTEVRCRREKVQQVPPRTSAEISCHNVQKDHAKFTRGLIPKQPHPSTISRKMAYVNWTLWQRCSNIGRDLCVSVLPEWVCAVTPHTTALCPRGSSSHVSSCPAKMEKEKTSVL